MDVNLGQEASEIGSETGRSAAVDFSLLDVASLRDREEEFLTKATAGLEGWGGDRPRTSRQGVGRRAHFSLPSWSADRSEGGREDLQCPEKVNGHNISIREVHLARSAP